MKEEVNPTRREVLGYIATALLGGAAISTRADSFTREEYDDPETSERVNNLEDLAERIENGRPADIIYDLGEREEKTGLLIGDRNYSARVEESPRIILYEDNGRTLMDIVTSNNETLMDIKDSNGEVTDITDSNGEIIQNAYRGLKPQSVRFEPSTCPYDPHDELGTLIIGLEDGKEVHINQYRRPEQ